MADLIDAALRGPKAFGLAREALDDMERRGVWPTPLNYELWIHALGDPTCELASEIERLLAAGEPISEAIAEGLAAAYLPKGRLDDQIRDAGARLNRELAEVAEAIKHAHESSEQYGETLAGAGRELAERQETATIEKLVQTLSDATRDVSQENKTLEQRLEESTAEVSRLRDHLEQVRRDAAIDGLTNLANRKSFDETLKRACEAARAKSERLALAVLDIDHFKIFNDSWGHQTGDQVLRYVASVISRNAPAPRFAARYGGEEFAVIFRGEPDGQVLDALEQMRSGVCSRNLKRRSTNEDLGAITISAGVAQLEEHDEIAALIERADAALYASKRGGRNRVTAANRLSDAA
ncbi:MAG TPA: diguanylate cyclase [Caulobacteraceae bacterium]|nr:diguanylate cyclase [Caulobacteraceae bacterium]